MYHEENVQHLLSNLLEKMKVISPKEQTEKKKKKTKKNKTKVALRERVKKRKKQS